YNLSATTQNDEARAVALQFDGKIVIAGLATNAAGNQAFAVIRLNPDGTLDSNGFNPTAVGSPAGTFIKQVSAGNNSDDVRAVAVQDDGKIVVVGTSYVDATRLNDVTMLRLNVNGSLDNGDNATDLTPKDKFSNGGLVQTNIGGNDGGRALIVDD